MPAVNLLVALTTANQSRHAGARFQVRETLHRDAHYAGRRLDAPVRALRSGREAKDTRSRSEAPAVQSSSTRDTARARVTHAQILQGRPLHSRGASKALFRASVRGNPQPPAGVPSPACRFSLVVQDAGSFSTRKDLGDLLAP